MRADEHVHGKSPERGRVWFFGESDANRLLPGLGEKAVARPDEGSGYHPEYVIVSWKAPHPRCADYHPEPGERAIVGCPCLPLPLYAGGAGGGSRGRAARMKNPP